jgi:putative transposase
MYSESRKHPARQLTVSVGNLGVILHITACTFRRRCILACDEIHNLIIDAWINAPEWTVGRYVIMPDHIHLFAAENEFQGYPLGQWVANGRHMCHACGPSERTSPSRKGAFGIIS